MLQYIHFLMQCGLLVTQAKQAVKQSCLECFSILGIPHTIKKDNVLLTQEKVFISFVLFGIFNTLQGFLIILKVRPLWKV
jgi:hypothetical protein